MIFVKHKKEPQVKTGTKHYVCHCGIPVECLREGYRIVHLQDRYGNLIEKGMSNLFLKIEIEESQHYRRETELREARCKLRAYEKMNLTLQIAAQQQKNEIKRLNKLLKEKTEKIESMKKKLTQKQEK